MIDAAEPLVTLGMLSKESGDPLWKLRRLFDRSTLKIRWPIRIGENWAIYAEKREAVLKRIREVA